MEATKAEEGSSDHEATVFGTSEPEGQKGTPERRKNRIKHPKIIAGVRLVSALSSLERASSLNFSLQVWLLLKRLHWGSFSGYFYTFFQNKSFGCLVKIC